MYKEYWGLQRKPFENTPDAEFFYPSLEHERGLQRLLYAVRARKAAVLLTGEHGCGKTLLCYLLLDEIQEDETYMVAQVNNPRVTPHELLREVLMGLGGTPRRGKSLILQLDELLQQYAKEGKHCVVVIDEAQLIDSDELLEELSLLVNRHNNHGFFATLILVGEPELRGIVSRWTQLEQRISVKHHLYAFDISETAAYILHRLIVAGATRPLFTQEAVDMIHAESGGVPRKINNLCDMCLLEGSLQHAKIVDSRLVRSIT